MTNQPTPNKGETNPLAKRAEDVFGTMRREIDHIFNRWGNGHRGWPTPFSLSQTFDLAAPDMDVRETAKEFVIEAELPGVDEKDVSMTLQNGVLTLKGEKRQERQEKQDGYYLHERSSGSFQRSMRLPDTADDGKVDAEFANGVLKIAIQKRADANKPEHKIEIKKG